MRFPTWLPFLLGLLTAVMGTTQFGLGAVAAGLVGAIGSNVAEWSRPRRG